MSWVNGSILLEQIVEEISDIPGLTRSQRSSVYEILIANFENYDCDEVDNLTGIDPAYDDALVSLGHDVEISEEDEDFEE